MTTRAGYLGYGLVVAAALALLAALGWWMLAEEQRPPGTSRGATEGGSARAATPLDFAPFTLAIDDLAPIWTAERAAPRPDDPDTAALIDAWHRANFVTALVEIGQLEGDHQAVIADWAEQLQAWLELRDISEYRSLSWTAWESFEAAFQETLRKARLTDTRLSDLLSNPLDPEVHLQYEACGGFMRHALRLGLVGELGTLEVRPELVLLLFRAKWFRDIDTLRSIERTMPGPELREYRRWRIEDGGLDLAPRLAAIDDFEATFGFRDIPVELARAVALSDGGDLAAATAALEEAARAAPDNPIVAAALAGFAAP